MNMDLITIINGLIIIVFAFYVNCNENKNRILYALFHDKLLYLIRMYYLYHNSIIDYNDIRKHSRKHITEIKSDMCIGLSQFWYVGLLVLTVLPKYTDSAVSRPNYMFLYYSIIPDAATFTDTPGYLLISLMFIDKLGVFPLSIYYYFITVKFSRCLIFAQHYSSVNKYSHSCILILKYMDSYIILALLTNFHKITWYLLALFKLLICILTCVLLIVCAYSTSIPASKPSRYPSCNYYSLFNLFSTIVYTTMEGVYAIYSYASCGILTRKLMWSYITHLCTLINMLQVIIIDLLVSVRHHTLCHIIIIMHSLTSYSGMLIMLCSKRLLLCKLINEARPNVMTTLLLALIYGIHTIPLIYMYHVMLGLHTVLFIRKYRYIHAFQAGCLSSNNASYRRVCVSCIPYCYMYLPKIYLSIVCINVFVCLSLPIFILEYG